MITMEVNTSITSDSFLFFFFVVRRFKTQEISSMQNMVLLLTVTILYIRSSELILIAGNVCPLTCITPCPHPPVFIFLAYFIEHVSVVSSIL